MRRAVIYTRLGENTSDLYLIVAGVFLQVNIWVPQPEKQLDVIKVTGLVANVERAKQGLLERVKELQAEQEDRVQQHGYLITTVKEMKLLQL